MQNKNIWIASAGLVILLGILFFFISGRVTVPSDTEDNTSASSTEESLDDLIKSGRVKISVSTTSASVTPARPAPNLNYSLKISPDLSSEAVAALKTQLTDLTAALKNDPRSFESWMRMGILAKIAGDYQRALEIWGYVAYLQPKSVQPFANMADLYANYLHDYAKAEANYKIAIQNDPETQMWKDALKELQARK